MLDEVLTPEERAVVARARDFAERHVAPNAARWEWERRYPLETIREGCKAGLHTIELAKKHGGQGLAQHASDGRFVVRVEQSGIRELRAELRSGSRRRDGTVIGATLLLGGLVWLAVGASLLPGLVLAGAGGLTIVFARRGG